MCVCMRVCMCVVLRAAGAKMWQRMQVGALKQVMLMDSSNHTFITARHIIFLSAIINPLAAALSISSSPIDHGIQPHPNPMHAIPRPPPPAHCCSLLSSLPVHACLLLCTSSRCSQGFLKVVAGIEVRFTLTAKASQAEEDEMAELYTVRVSHECSTVKVPAVSLVRVKASGTLVVQCTSLRNEE